MTSVAFHADTKNLPWLVRPGQPVFGIEATHEGTPVVFGGDMLLRTAAGEIVGGVRVSAGTVAVDHQVADAGGATGPVATTVPLFAA